MFEREDIICQKERESFLEIVDFEKGLRKRRDAPGVLRGMNFSVAKGEFCVLLGPSGSGKSTLLNIIGGIDSADSGYISINGDKLKDMSEKKLTQYRRKHLGYVFQMYNLIANLNVKEISRWALICLTTHWISMSCFTRWGFTSTVTSFRTSYQADSSSVCQ